MYNMLTLFSSFFERFRLKGPLSGPPHKGGRKVISFGQRAYTLTGYECVYSVRKLFTGSLFTAAIVRKLMIIKEINSMAHPLRTKIHQLSSVL